MEPHWAAAHFRAGDDDRDRVVEALKQCFTEGRIDADELSDRIGLALNAKTYGDLERVMTGLPAVRLGPAVYPNTPMFYGPQPPRPQARANGMGIAALVLGMFGIACGITALPAVALGSVALFLDSQREDKGLAIAGVVLGAVWALLYGMWLF
ncbi:DUF1707 and DUF4190 domain-containing protein [Nocardia crassostreae]|uniref:DUF1707 and DUF4190 domain-containing protein n=1 Tax=Nocardia crassostreae TaxID=53428 RepID=UPI000834C15A|nr:DUF1707 and DUF4190 domain-containing protein [Nocardia crassostreae]